MQSMSTSTANFLSNVGKQNAKAVHNAQNNTALRAAIERTWGNKPEAVKWLLQQINAMYIELDERPRKASAQKKPPAIMKLYVRDAMARAELNAKRETLQLTLARYGIHVDEIQLLQARGDAKKHQVFSDESLKTSLSANKNQHVSKNQSPQTLNTHVDQTRLLETLRRAFCLSFDDPDQAYDALSMIEGARMQQLKSTSNRREKYLWYRAYFYTSPSKLTALKEFVSAYQDTIKSKARMVGLNITGIGVELSPEDLAGKQAFPRAGQPVPYLK